MNDLVYVAKIGKTHGLLGFLKLHNKSDFYEQFKAGAKFYNAKKESFVIKNFDKDNSLVRFVGYEDINSAKKLVNLDLYSTIEDSRKNIKLAKDEYFYFDLIGLKVYENDELLGAVENILETGSTYLLAIKTDEKLAVNLPKNFYIPYHDNFIIKIKNDILVKNAKIILENS